MRSLQNYSGGIHRGAGAVARYDEVCIVTPGSDDNFDAIDDFYNRLPAKPTFRQVTEIAEVLVAELRTFAAIGITDDDTMAVAFGDIEIVLNGEVILQAEAGLREIIVSLDEESVVSIRTTSDEGQGPVVPYDLRSGIAPGGGITLAPLPQAEKIDDQEETLVSEPIEGIEPKDLVEENVEDTAEDDQSDFVDPEFEIDLDQDAFLIKDLPKVASKPLPSTSEALAKAQAKNLVVGKHCSREHFNPAEQEFCRICGVSLEHIDEIDNAPRPTLGFVIFDDGATYGLDRSYRIGRNPDSDENLESLRIYEGGETISRNHAEIHLTDWDVTVKDLGSTNGTFIWNNGNQSWSQIPEGSEVKLEPGTTVALGRRAFVYESVGESSIV